MGSQHLRVYGDLSARCTIVAVGEKDAQRREILQRRTEVECFSDYRGMLAKTQLDAVSVAVPNELHCATTIDFLRSGVDVLVEKPMALSLAEARKMIRVAKENKRILMVGHVERFNPVVQFVRKYVADGKLGEIYYLSSRRIGAYPDRLDGPGNLGVSLDLAIHDVDVMRFIMNRRPRVIHKVKMKKRSTKDDYVSFTLGFGGTVGILEASWLSPYKIRQLLVNGQRGLAMVDYLAQSVEIVSHYTQKPELSAYRDFLDLDYEISKPAIKKEEPLRLELNHFLDCVMNRSTPSSDGLNGLENLKVVV